MADVICEQPLTAIHKLSTFASTIAAVVIKLLKTSISIKSSRPPSVEMVGEIVAGEMRKKAVKPIIPLVLTNHTPLVSNRNLSSK